jgi:hypothetical protein
MAFTVAEICHSEVGLYLVSFSESNMYIREFKAVVKRALEEIRDWVRFSDRKNKVAKSQKWTPKARKHYNPFVAL